MIKRATGEDSIHVTFELPPAVKAREVFVSGEFNGWTSTPLERQEDGWFRVTLPLACGRSYRFRYLLDGERWENDWSADLYTPNDFGGEDSVVDLSTVTSKPPPATAQD